jgi:YfaZ precursor
MRILKGLARPGLSTIFIGLLIGAPANAHEVNLGFNEDALRATYATGFSNNLRVEAGWLTDSDEGDVVHAGLLVVGDVAPAGQKLTGGIGARLAYLDGEGNNREGYALGVGGSLRWAIPRYDRFAVYGEYYWAPEILSGGDAEKYVDTSIRLGYSVTKQADLYVGARYTGAEYDDRPEILFDTGMHIGFELRF